MSNWHALLYNCSSTYRYLASSPRQAITPARYDEGTLTANPKAAPGERGTQNKCPCHRMSVSGEKTCLIAINSNDDLHVAGLVFDPGFRYLGRPTKPSSGVIGGDEGMTTSPFSSSLPSRAIYRCSGIQQPMLTNCSLLF